MAVIPTGQKFHTVNENIGTADRGSNKTNSSRESYTMQDIIDTVPTGGDAVYTSLFVKLTQSGSNNPSYSVLSNDTDISFTGLFYGTGYTSLVMASGTYPAQGQIMVVTGGFKSSRSSWSTMTGHHDGQQIKIITGYYDFTGAEATFVKDDFGFGGVQSTIVEIRVFA